MLIQDDDVSRGRVKGDFRLALCWHDLFPRSQFVLTQVMTHGRLGKPVVIDVGNFKG